MDLYRVYPRGDTWCCYVFEETRNKARAKLVGHFDSENDYTAFNAVRVKKGIGGEPEICDTDCERLEKLGIRYATEEDGNEYFY